MQTKLVFGIPQHIAVTAAPRDCMVVIRIPQPSMKFCSQEKILGLNALAVFSVLLRMMLEY